MQIQSALDHLCLFYFPDLPKGGVHGRVLVPDVSDIDGRVLAPEKGGATHLALRRGGKGRGNENVDRKAYHLSNLTP